MTLSNSYRRIYAIVARIPRGRVATYGQVAQLAGLPAHPRLVGYALSSLPEGTRLPWHRVVNAQGRVSPRTDGSPMALIQRRLLEKEGIRFDARGLLSLEKFRWKPRGAPPGAGDDSGA